MECILYDTLFCAVVSSWRTLILGFGLPIGWG
jgi:hypothetical protein